MTMKQQDNPYPLRYNYDYKPKVLNEYNRIFFQMKFLNIVIKFLIFVIL